MPVVRFPHALYYPDNEDIPLSDIAATLLAHERLLPIIGSILERSVEGLQVQKLSISLEKVERSSLTEAFFVALFIAFQEDLDRELPALIEALTGYQIDDRFETLVSVLFMVLLYYGTVKLLGKGKNKKESIPAAIQTTFNTHLIIAADQLDISPQQLELAVDDAVGKKRQPTVMRAAIDLFRPAKRGGNGRIIPLNLPEIPAEAVAEFPNDIALADMGEDTVPIPIDGALLKIRASDRDKSTQGWAGILEAGELKTRRLPVTLYPTVDRELLATLPSAMVDAILESKLEDDGDTKPKRIHVLRLTDQRDLDNR